MNELYNYYDERLADGHFELYVIQCNPIIYTYLLN